METLTRREWWDGNKILQFKKYLKIQPCDEEEKLRAHVKMR